MSKMKKNIVLVLTIFIIIFCNVTPAHATTSNARPKFIFAVYGQSNAGLIFSQLKAALIKKYGPKTQVILVAQGNTAMAELQKGEPLYDILLKKIIYAKAHGYVFGKLFVYQGEADSRVGLPELWEGKFVQMVSDLRKDSKSFPEIVLYTIGQCPRTACLEWYQVVHYQQKTAIDNPGYVMIYTADIPNYPTAGVPHHSPDGYAVLVRRTLSIMP